MKHILEGFKLYYEKLEGEDVKSKKKTTKKAEPVTKITIKGLAKTAIAKSRSKIDNIVSKIRKPQKRGKKLTKMQQKALQDQRKRGILGIGLLFVVVSIAYSTYITRTFVDTRASLVALIPQVVFALYILFKAFSKLYK